MKLYLNIYIIFLKNKNNDIKKRLFIFYIEVFTHKDFDNVDKTKFKEI